MRRIADLKNNILILSIVMAVSFFLPSNLYGREISPEKAQLKREAFVKEAKKYEGLPYELGAEGPKKFDCSGYVYYVANKSLGIQLPRTARAMYNYCSLVTAREREIGDLVFFRTGYSGTINHVGIYIGDGKFISALSDGPQTGIQIASLSKDYWAKTYVATGKFLPRGMHGNLAYEDPDKPEAEFFYTDEELVQVEKNEGEKVAKSNNEDKPFVHIDKTEPATYTVNNSTFKGSSHYSPGGTLKNSLVFDGTILCNWSLFSPKEFMIKFRGVDIFANLRMSNVILEPGLGVIFRINTSMKVFQMPIVLTLTLNEYMRFYAGPVISFATPKMVDTDRKLSASIFPGIIGASFSTPALNFGKIGVQLVQDISYTVFNKHDNSALSFTDSICAGLQFNTGLRITFDI